MHEALCRSSGTTLDSVHAEDGPPITQRTSGLRLEAAGYPIVLHVHDEIVAEIPEGGGDLEEFERLMAETPEWAEDFPVKAEGRRAKRFGK